MSSTFTRRDREVSRQTHRLFWRASFADKTGLLFWVLARPLALVIYNVIIPFQIAYGLQAIITRQFDKADNYAYTILFLGIGFCILWTIGGISISRNGRVSLEYVQRTVFSNYLEKDYDFFSNTYLGALGSQLSRLKDASIEYKQLFLNGAMKQVIVVVASTAIIAYQSLVLALVTLASMALVLSFTLLSSKWRLKYRRLVSEASSETAGVIGDALGQGAVVKSFAAEEHEQKRLDISLKKLGRAHYWSWMASVPTDVGRIFLAMLATVILLVMTGQLFESGTISIAVVILVQLYVVRLVLATHDIADLIKAYDALMGGVHQAVKTMMIEPTVVDKPQPKKLPANAKCELTLQDVSYRYDDSRDNATAIEDFTLHLKQGEKIGLVGYSGSGKTTLTKLLLRFMDVTSGSIMLDGIDIRDISQKELRRNIAYVPQEPLLFHRSIAENIGYGRPDATEEEIREAGRAAYVDEFVEELSAGYDTLVGEKGIKLSGGQRQRVAIARALLKDAPILVLDEATSALDSRSEGYIQKALWKLMEGRTALVIAHRLSTIQRMDRIVVVDKGRIVEIDTHAELISGTEGIYSQLWAHQSGGYLEEEASKVS